MLGRLMPREGKFFDLFTAHAERIVEGSRELAAMLGTFTELEMHAQRIDGAERAADDGAADRILRRLEAMLAVADRQSSLIITGQGDVLEPEFGIVAIGSGGAYAQAAARALLDHTTLSAAAIVKEALTIAGDICIYSNQQHSIETLPA